MAPTLPGSRRAHAARGYPIGRLAELTDLPVKTIRFYSDEGLLPPAGRSEAGHRRYGEAAVARLQLIRSLRSLGLDLGAIRAVLDGHDDVRSVLLAHISTLDTRIRGLERQRAVLRAAITSPPEVTMNRVNALARLDRAERARLLDHFWDEAIGGLPLDPTVAKRFRSMGTPDLPDDPTPAQLDAWIELAELASDADFQHTTRRNATFLQGASGGDLDTAAWARVIATAMRSADGARGSGVTPTDPEAQVIADAFASATARLLGRPDGRDFRVWLATETRAHTDPRAERYWRLVAVVRGSAPSPESPEQAQTQLTMEWLLESLVVPA